MKLENLGLNSWYKNQIDKGKLNAYRLARVIAVNKDNYIIKNEKNETQAEITGKLMFNAESSLDYPAVGDWVYTQYFNDDSMAIIHEIIPRKSVLKRKTSGKKIEFQIIAANIDVAFIIQSLDTNFNLRRLERYLVMVHETDIRPIVLLSKSDLLSQKEIEEKKFEIHVSMPDLQVVAFSNLDRLGFEMIQKILIPGFTYCLLGSSGVGKTTLLNNLLTKALFKTRTVREKDSRGRHTTPRRQLIMLHNGAMIIDTPGMRELGNIGVDTGLHETFDEISTLAGQCRFNDCTHTQEAGCEVLAAMKDGKISQDRYNHFIKMNKESAYNKMSYVEKRRKDKAFGKFCKSVMKHKKKK